MLDQGYVTWQNDHMLNPTWKEWIQILTPMASALVAICAIGVTVRLGALQRRIQEGQRRIQEAQLKNSLYDRRFAVYEASGECIAGVMRTNGDLDMRDLLWHPAMVEKGELLFGPEVGAYLRELNQKVGVAYSSANRAKHHNAMGDESAATAEHLKIGEMMRDFSGPMRERRRSLFHPYLQLTD